jgi:hypothetical protein
MLNPHYKVSCLVQWQSQIQMKLVEELVIKITDECYELLVIKSLVFRSRFGWQEAT